MRYGETDQMAVVHHANYLLYFEESRTRLMAERGCSYAALERSGIGLPVRRVELRYRAPAVYDDALVIRTHVGKVGAASITFVSEVRRESDDALLANGSVELACIDLRNRKRGPIPLPDELRGLLPDS